MATISIIVPVYNVEEYLSKCLQSLICQSYDDIEILLIDDGSTDCSSQICDSFAEKNDKVKVFHTPNQGVSAARNIGIDNATGDFIMFVDGDDWVEPDFCSVPLMLAIKEKADVVMFGFCKEGNRLENHAEPNYTGQLLLAERFRLYEELLFVYCWNKIYRRELFNGVRFPVGYYYEDTPVAYKILYKATKMWYIGEVLYHYRTRKGSVTSTKTHAKANNHFETRMMAVDDLLSWGMKDEAEKLRCSASFTYILRMDNRGKHTQECIDYFRSDEYRKDVLSWKSRLMVKTFITCPTIFAVISACFGRRAQ